MSYKCLLNDEKSEHKIPGFRGYPTTLFLDRSGKVRMSLFGYTPKAKLEVIVPSSCSPRARIPEAANAGGENPRGTTIQGDQRCLEGVCRLLATLGINGQPSRIDNES